MTAILKLPCQHEAYYLARNILRREYATPDELRLAIETLATSRDWMDQQLCRDVQRALDLQVAWNTSARDGFEPAHRFPPLKTQEQIDSEEPQEVIERARDLAGWLVAAAVLLTGAGFVIGQAIKAAGWL